MPNDCSSGVSRYRSASSACGLTPTLHSITSRVPFSRSVRSLTSAMPVSRLCLFTSSVMRSITFSGPTP